MYNGYQRAAFTIQPNTCTIIRNAAVFVPVAELALPRQTSMPVKSSPHFKGSWSYRVICATSF